MPDEEFDPLPTITIVLAIGFLAMVFSGMAFQPVIVINPLIHPEGLYIKWEYQNYTVGDHANISYYIGTKHYNPNAYAYLSRFTNPASRRQESNITKQFAGYVMVFNEGVPVGNWTTEIVAINKTDGNETILYKDITVVGAK